ncbi:MAG: MMPL family transporter [Proteobacteria bacterium]|nr:MMPL family transporter [Pseudomonadota bacterium]MBU1685862.1 MMPL family transporter [Pseudomonadota bacterium]
MKLSSEQGKDFGLSGWRLFIILGVTLLGVYSALSVKLDEDALDLLPGPEVRRQLVDLSRLGMVNRIFLSFDFTGPNQEVTADPNQLVAEIARVGSILSADPLFREVFYRLPEGYEFRLAGTFHEYLPVLVDGKDREAIRERLAPERLREFLVDDFLKLNSVAGLPLIGMIRRDPLDFTSIVLEKMKGLRGGMQISLWNGFFLSKDLKHGLLWLEGLETMTDTVNAVKVKQSIDRAVAGAPTGIRIRVVGPFAHTIANAEAIRHDLAKLLPIAMGILAVFLLAVFRSWRALVVVAVPFLAIPPAIALVGLFSPSISAMALGFGIVLLGIAVDFAVHIYYGFHRGQGFGPSLKTSVLMAAGTTIGVFVVLLFSQIPAHRQMALLALGGIGWALVLSWWLVPMVGRGCKQSPALIDNRLLCFVQKTHRWNLIRIGCWLVLLLAGLAGWGSLRYSGDLKSLDMPDDSISQNEEAFLRIWGSGVDSAFVVARGSSSAEALNVNDQVYFTLREEGGEGFQSLAPLLPGPARQNENLASWRLMQQENLPQLELELPVAAVDAGFTADAFAPFLDWFHREATLMDPGLLLESPLRPLLMSLYREVGTSEGAGEDEVLVATIVPETTGNRLALAGVARSLPEVSILSGGLWRQQVEKLLHYDLIRLSSLAALVIILLCWVYFRRLRLMAAALAPVVAALSAMVVFISLTDGLLNMMHVLMGIMVIGLSVDYGIFVVQACRSDHTAATFPAVSVCAVTTLSGFGVLAFAGHPALHALGVTVLVGIGAAWPTALLVTPALLPWEQEL